MAQLIFEAGLSCRDDVGSVSGRGVGLDAARRAIEAGAGSIEVSSVAGTGSRCVIDLPLMVALQRVLVLEVGGEAVALPSASIASVVSAREGRLERSANEAFFVWKDEPIPVLDLALRVGVPSRVPDRDASLVVLENRGLRFGLRVDRVVADREVFVRGVPAALESVGGLAGVAILPEGVPTFLLDVAQLFGEAG